MDRIVGSATVGIANLVAKKRQAGADVVSFSVGEPDFPTPQHVVDAAKAALDAGHTKYTPGMGIPALREAIAKQSKKECQIPADASNVLVTPAKQAVAMTVLALADRGDEVLVPDPGWVSYAPITQWAHATPVPIGLDAEHQFGIQAETVQEKITNKTKLIILNSPSNPTGGVSDPKEVKAVMELAEDHDFWVLSDELYRKLIYDGKHVSPASMSGMFDRTITIDGLSKSFAMTGWRIGWAVGPKEAIGQINKLQEHSVTHCTSFAQHGALAAVEGPQDSVEAMRRAFIKRRDLIVEGMNRLPGVTCPMPQGAFYVFPKFEQAGNDDWAFCERLINEANVAPTPGSAFGKNGVGHLRFSYATSEDRIREGLKRIEAFLQKR